MESSFQPADATSTKLRARAREASTRAYVPYSRFRVGAVVACSDGTLVTGCNVENASYGLTICAERTALVRLIAEGHDPATIERIAIHVDGPDGQPCGMCRQFMVELAPNAIVSFVSGARYVAAAALDLLPAAFVPEVLDA